MDGELDRLTRAHHAQQARIALAAARETRTAFRGVDLSSDRDLGRAVGTALPTLLQRRAASARATRNYYRQTRLISIGGSADIPPDPDEQDAEDRTRASLWILARGRQRIDADTEEERRRTEAATLRRATTELVGAAVRHTLDGGREDLVTVVRGDSSAWGWVRVTSQDNRVCAFCMMLASREDYKSTSFRESDARFKMGGNPLANAKAHDGCRCSLRPVFYGQGTPEHTRVAQRLWYDLSEGDGREAWLSFRRNYDAMMRTQTPVWQAA